VVFQAALTDSEDNRIQHIDNDGMSPAEIMMTKAIKN
jgi:hypothetical protein